MDWSVLFTYPWILNELYDTFCKIFFLQQFHTSIIHVIEAYYVNESSVKATFIIIFFWEKDFIDFKISPFGLFHSLY